MRRLSALLAILFALVCASTLNANIYDWIDEDGVKNFTNFSPPEGAEIFIKDSVTKEIFIEKTITVVTKNTTAIAVAMKSSTGQN